MLVAVETFLPLVLAILGLPLLVLFTTLRPAKPHRVPSHSIEGPRPNQAWTIMKNIVKHGIPMTLDHGASDRVRSERLWRDDRVTEEHIYIIVRLPSMPLPCSQQGPAWRKWQHLFFVGILW